MGSKGGSAPDYTGAAEAQAAADFENMQYQTRSNRPDMNTPWYSSDWSDMGGGFWSNTVTPSDALQGALDDQLELQTGRSGLALGMLGQTGLDMQTPDNFWSDLSPISYSPEVPSFYGSPNVPSYDDYQRVDISGYGNEFKTVPGTAGVLNPEYLNAMQGWNSGQIGDTGIGDYGAPPSSGNMWLREPGDDQQVRVIPERPEGPNQTTNSLLSMVGSDPQNLYGLSDINPVYDSSFEEAMYDRAMSLLRPEQEQNSASNLTMLANMGLSQGGEAYDDSVLDLRNQQDEATQRVAWDSVLYGAQEYNNDFLRQLAERDQQFDEMAFSQEQQLSAEAQDFYQQLSAAGFGEAQRAAAWGEQNDIYNMQFQDALMGNAILDQQFNQGLQAAGFNNSAMAQNFGLGLQGAGFDNTARNQLVADQQMQEAWSLNKINALINGQQVQTPQFQNFSNAGYTGGPDYLGATQQQTQWQGQVNSMWGDIWGGLFGGVGKAAGGGFFGPGFG